MIIHMSPHGMGNFKRDLATTNPGRQKQKEEVFRGPDAKGQKRTERKRHVFHFFTPKSQYSQQNITRGGHNLGVWCGGDRQLQGKRD